jgi:hypothetical protein
MMYEPILRREAQEPESLASDFGLIIDAFTDAFRGLSASSQFDGRSQKRPYAGLR